MVRRVGLWLVGAFGGVGTTAALGLAALRRGLAGDTGLVTALPPLRALDLDAPGQFVVGGHDVRRTDFVATARHLQGASRLFDRTLVDACAEDLRAWSQEIRPGTLREAGDAVRRLADWSESAADTALHAVERIQADLRAFRERHHLEQLAVINVASTEPPFALGAAHQSVAILTAELGRRSASALPASGLYAWAALDLGLPYVNFTPSLGASFPAALELAEHRRAPVAGRDAKTGETLLKTVLAPMFARRNLRVRSWVGHNILGDGDGLVLADPAHKASKVRSKDEALGRILGDPPETRVSIEYVESMGDWKTAWDHIQFEGFLGVRMALQLTWQGSDSALAAPLVIDLARLALVAQRRGEAGVLRHLSCFFKDPMGVEEHDFFRQYALLEAYAAG